MKRSLRGNNSQNGFTLAELMVTTAVLSLIMTSACGMFVAVTREWERQQGEGNALVAVSNASTRLSDYISQAVAVTVINRFTTGDTIAVNMPADSANNVYVPTWSSGKVQYRSGSWLVFYLSDNTGSYSRTGNILWAATMTWAGYPGSVVPDTSWSMYFNTGKGRITPLKSLQFSSVTSGNSTKVVMTIISSYKVRTTEKALTVTRTVYLRNAG